MRDDTQDRINVAMLLALQTAYSGICRRAKRRGMAEEEIAGFEAEAVRQLREARWADGQPELQAAVVEGGARALQELFDATRRMRLKRP